MLYLSRPSRVFLCGLPVDFRKQITGLCLLVQAEFGAETFRTSWFVFVARDKRKVKILYWRGTGFALWQMQLEKDRFDMGRPRFANKKVISWQELGRFLDGYNIFAGEPHQPLMPKRF